ncbi:tetratricopeptide repeat-containing sensor histidine kinase [Pedobacter sp. SD-b]|uniref:histidine kinase n=1 Tax=Pedobacter segetis TaxID=2793069 RepID=A0ABS1BLU8_9SPHI|nr:tetratricopeptide repeat-containing sensor histidine kinase [Pedobacter segetis]MBK0383276.1 tetratricopeptide repeat-containing sensor histidine kinase [Pedobacter segetis]
MNFKSQKFFFFFLTIALFFSLQTIFCFADPKTTDQDSVKLGKYLSILKKIDPKNVDSIIAISDKAILDFKHQNSEYDLCKINQGTGFILSKYGYLGLSEKYYTDALALSKKIKNTSLEVDITNSLGVLWGKRGDFLKAESYFLKALLSAKKTNYQEGVAAAYFKLGVVRTKQNKPNEALEFYLKVDSVNQKNGTHFLKNDLIANKAIIYAIRGDLDNALKQFELSYKIAAEERNLINQVLALQNIGLVYKEKKQYQKALSILEKGINTAKKSNLKEEELRITINVPLVVFEQKKYHLAQTQLLDLLKKAKKLGLEDLQVEIYNVLVETSEAQNNFKSAFDYYKSGSNIKDKQINEQKQRALAEANASLGLYKANAKILEGNQLLFQTRKERNIILVVLIAIAILSFVLIFVLIRLKNTNDELSISKIELTESNSIKNKLFSIIGHDLRGGHGSTLGILGLIKNGDLDAEEQAKYLDLIIKQSTSSLETLDDLLLWGKAQIKGNNLQKVNIQILPVIQKVIDLNIKAINEKKLVLNTIDLEGKSIFMDANHFAFIIRNLMANAIKFTPSNGQINIYAENHQNNLIKICVADNGIGIPEEDLKNIFLPDSKSRRGTNNEKGTGLGLTLCNEFVMANGGKIWAEQNNNQGTVLCFTCEKG